MLKDVWKLRRCGCTSKMLEVGISPKQLRHLKLAGDRFIRQRRYFTLIINKHFKLQLIQL